jgi:hypothetical protein
MDSGLDKGAVSTQTGKQQEATKSDLDQDAPESSEVCL